MAPHVVVESFGIHLCFQEHISRIIPVRKDIAEAEQRDTLKVAMKGSEGAFAGQLFKDWL